MSNLSTENEEEVLHDAWDYKGRPANKHVTGGWTSAAMILGIEMNERLTTMGSGANLVPYLTGTMHMGTATSAKTVANFIGTSFLLCLFGGFVADTYLGRYLTIAISVVLQASGVAILTISTIIPSLRPPKCDRGSQDCVPPNDTQLLVLYVALYTMAFGIGGIKSSVSGFGSDQFNDSDKKEHTQMTNFFSWFFFSINIGTLAAVTVCIYVQDNVGRQWGYCIFLCAIVIGLIVFLSGKRRYRFKKVMGSPLTQIASVHVAAWRKRHQEVPYDTKQLFDIDNIAREGQDNKKKEKLPHSKQFRFLDKAAIKDPENSANGITIVNRWKLSTITDVEEVKQVIRMLPIWATTIMFWTVYAQMTTICVAQAATMDRHIGRSFQIPPASLTVFFVATIILVVPLYDRVIVPVSKKLLKSPQGLTPLQCMGIGIVFSIFAMAVAALIEIKRLHVAHSRPLPANAPMLSVFWLVPQYFLVGVAETFMYIGQLDFFLRECPKGMKTMSTGLFMSTLALGFFFSSILMSIVESLTHKHPWLTNNLNNGKLYNFYWLLAVLSVLDFVFYLWGSKWYVYKDHKIVDEGSVMEERV